MNQSGAVVDNQISDALQVLSKDLYLSIYTMALNFDVPSQTFQKKITGVDPLLSRSPNNKALSNTQE